MEKTLVFGHKNPDTDSVASAIVMAEFEKKLGNEAQAVTLGKVNKETKYVFDYLQIEDPVVLENIEDGQKVILVDHNESKQSIEGLEKTKIIKVIDHHMMDFKVSYPMFYHSEPVGCTATILYKMYKQNDFEIDKKLAILMISAIISDTLLFKSPTCTKEDIDAAYKLNEIAKLDLEKYGMEMLKAGTDLSDYSTKELINLDAKEVTIKDIKAVVAQINTVSIEDTLKRKEEFEEDIKQKVKDSNLDLFMFVITDIINSNSFVLAFGNRVDLIEKSYNVKLDKNSAFLAGVVSRKKQIIPVLTENA